MNIIEANLVTSCQDKNVTEMDMSNFDFIYQSGYMKNRLAEIRTACGLSQEELGELVGASRVQISRLENAKRQLTQRWMDRITKSLNNAGFKHIKAWHFIHEPSAEDSIETLYITQKNPKAKTIIDQTLDELFAIAKNDLERELIIKTLSLNSDDKKTILNIADALVLKREALK